MGDIMVKFISVCLSLLIGFQPIVHACENIEPIDPESLEYDPLTYIKKRYERRHIG